MENVRKRRRIYIPPAADQSTGKAAKPSGAQPQSNSESSKGSIGEFIAIASVPLVLVLGNSMLVPILPELQKQLQISAFQSSLIISLFSVAAGLIIPVTGYLSDRFSRKAVMMPALIIYGLAGILAGLGAIWHSYGIVIAGRALQGIGAAGTAPIAMALAGDLYQGGTESKALGLTEAANGAGKVLSPILGSALALLIWYAPFFAFPLFCLLSLLALAFLIKEPKKKKEPPALKAYLKQIGQILATKGKWMIPSFFTGAMSLFVLFGVLFFLSNVLEKQPYQIDGILKGCVLAIPLLGMVIASYTTGALIKKNGTVMRWVMNIGMGLMTLALAASIFAAKDHMVLLISFLTISSICTGLVLPCLNTLITGAVEREQRGMITSIYNSLRFLGVAFGPPLFSYMMDRSYRSVFIMVTILALIAFGLVFFLIKPKGQLQG